MKKYIDVLISVVTFLVFISVVILLTSCDRALRKEIESLREELAKQQQYVPLDRDTIRDSVSTITQKVIEVERIKEVLSKEDKQLIKDLGMKVKELEALQKTGLETKDSVELAKKDSTENAPLIYHDAWTDFELRENKLSYTMRDSLAIAIEREYRHRFLWLKWKVKGYNVKVANFNPHSSVKYNTFVKKSRK